MQTDNNTPKEAIATEAAARQIYVQQLEAKIEKMSAHRRELETEIADLRATLRGLCAYIAESDSRPRYY